MVDSDRIYTDFDHHVFTVLLCPWPIKEGWWACGPARLILDQAVRVRALAGVNPDLFL